MCACFQLGVEECVESRVKSIHRPPHSVLALVNMDVVDDYVHQLRKYVLCIDVKKVRHVLDVLGLGETRQQMLKDNSDLIHQLIQSERVHKSSNHSRIKILYMLIDAGADVNATDAYNQTPLWLAMKYGNVAVVQVLLQCGANTLLIYGSFSFWDWLHPDVAAHCNTWCENLEDIQRVFMNYGKGMGPAVQEGDIDSIRIAINFCCRTDISMDGMTLLDIAFENSDENIIRLITRVTPYLKLAHHILAQDVPAVSQWYENEIQHPSPIFPVPLFHFGPYSNVPLIYFAIQYQNIELIRLLLSKGHRITTRISHEDLGDMPALFGALQSDIPVDVVRASLEHLDRYEEKLHHLFWLDCNILQVALRHRCSVDVVRLLLQQGGPILLCQRNSRNQTAREMALSLNLPAHIDVIDDTVTDWLTSNQPGSNEYRSLLALYSYEFGSLFDANADVNGVATYKKEFYRLQDQLEDLYNALMDRNVEQVEKLMIFEGAIIGRYHLPLESRLAGEGLPLLHMAVLGKAEDVVSLMVAHVQPHDQTINNLRDQFGRTALHYAYASTDSTHLIQILLGAGCSEAVFDMNGRRPDDYKEMRGSPEMEQLLSCLRIQDYSSPLIDPLEPNCVSNHRKRQWEKRVEAYRQNQSSFVGCRGTSLQNGSHFRHPLNDQPIWCTIL